MILRPNNRLGPYCLGELCRGWVLILRQIPADQLTSKNVFLNRSPKTFFLHFLVTFWGLLWPSLIDIWWFCYFITSPPCNTTVWKIYPVKNPPCFRPKSGNGDPWKFYPKFFTSCLRLSKHEIPKVRGEAEKLSKHLSPWDCSFQIGQRKNNPQGRK